MADNDKEKITHSHLVLCEGKDAFYFLIHYLNSEALSDVTELSNDFQVMDFKGISQLTKKLATLRNMEGFEKLESLSIIRDAETDADGAVASVRNSLNSAGFGNPEAPGRICGKLPKVGFVLFPTCSENAECGTLEDLCLSILNEENSEAILEDVQSFIQDMNEKHDRQLKREHKTKLHAYFSVTDKYVGMKIGEAAKAKAFNWRSEKLKPLKTFLTDMI